MELSHHRGERVLRYPRPRGLGCRHVRYVYVCSVYRCVACIYVWCTRAWCVHVGCAHTNIVVCACDVCPQNDLHTLTVQPAVCRPVYAHVHTSVNTSLMSLHKCFALGRYIFATCKLVCVWCAPLCLLCCKHKQVCT